MHVLHGFRCVWQVQKHLQLRIEAQGKYMQSILEKAYQTLAGENMASAATNLKGIGPQTIPDMGIMKEFGSPLGFSFQDLDLYGGGGGDQLELQQNMEKPPLDGFMPMNHDNLCLGKKRPNPYSGNNGKSPLMWSDDLRLQDLGSCLQDDPFKGDHHHQIQIAPPSLDRGTEMDPMSEIYDSKPEEKKFDASMKLERPSPRRAPLGERMSPMITTGTMAQGRSSPFG